MVLPISLDTAAEAYAAIRRYGRQAYDLGTGLQQFLDQGAVLSSYLLDVATQGAAIVRIIADVRNVPGLVDYTRGQLGADATTDVAALLNAAVGSLAQLAAAIRSEYPQDAAGMLLDRRFQADGQVAPITIAAADLPATAQALSAFLATLA